MKMLHDSSHMTAMRPQNNFVQALHPLCPATKGTPNQWEKYKQTLLRIRIIYPSTAVL